MNEHSKDGQSTLVGGDAHPRRPAARRAEQHPPLPIHPRHPLLLVAVVALGGAAPVSPQPPAEPRASTPAAPAAPAASPAATAGFAGGLREVDEDGPLAVRHDVHQAGSEVVTLRWFKIRDGSFDEFLRASIDGVWPYYEKLGARVIGMWRVTGRDGPPASAGGDDGEPAFDEVYLATRYASVAHWEATREPQRLGGNGPDWEACEKALAVRRGLTLETHLVFLEGAMASNGPYFQPALPERYRLIESEPTSKPPGREP
jgi:hypothetical protein